MPKRLLRRLRGWKSHSIFDARNKLEKQKKQKSMMKKLRHFLLAAAVGLLAAAPLSPAGAQAYSVPLADIWLGDPCVLADWETMTYYMTGTWGRMRLSRDLSTWTEERKVAATDNVGWMGTNPAIWAAELHRYNGKYYYFATFNNDAGGTTRRSVHILQSDRPEGPYRAIDPDKIYTPSAKPTLDGTLWVEEEKPYLVYCYEWTKSPNGGTIEYMELADDLSSTRGTVREMLRANQAEWNLHGGVTDGPWLFRTGTGRLGMIWSSWRGADYATGVAYSASGTLAGPWVHEKDPIVPMNYGHGMIFQTFEGRWLLCIHSHKGDSQNNERHPVFFDVDFSGDKLVVGGRYIPQPLTLEEEAGVAARVLETLKSGSAEAVALQEQIEKSRELLPDSWTQADVARLRNYEIWAKAGLFSASESNPVATHFVQNPTFDLDGAMWTTYCKEGYSIQNHQINNNQAGDFSGNFFELWDSEPFCGGVRQEVENIPNGKYELSIAAFSWTPSSGGRGAYVFGNGERAYVTSSTPRTYTMQVDVTDNRLVCGLAQDEPLSGWVGLDNVRLTYLGNAPTGVEEVEAGREKPELVGVDYYTADGRKLPSGESPSGGVVIERKSYSDRSLRVEKRIVQPRR